MLITVALVMLACTNSEPVSQAWTRRAPVEIPRSEMAAVVVDSSIYAIGGLVSTAQGFAATESVERYLPDEDRWEQVAALPSPRHHLVAAAVGGLVYVVGGYSAEGFIPVASGWSYDPATNVWTEIPDLPEAKGAGAADTLDGLVYLVGGVPNGTETLVFDPADQSWTSLAPMQQPREHFAVVAYDDKLWALGGRWEGIMLRSVEVFDPALGTWTEGPGMIDARSGFGAAVVDGAIFVGGGEVFDPTRTLDEVESLVDGVWTAAPKLPVPLHGVPMVAIAQDLFVIAGSKEAGNVVNSADTWLLGG